MNIPFPVIYPPIITPDWFHADQPCDEDAEITELERANEQWLNSIGKKYMKHAPTVHKPPPEPTVIDEAVVSDDDANEDAEETEDSQDVDEEEDMPTTDSPPVNNEGESESPEDMPTTDSPQENNEGESESPEDNTEAADLEVEAALWPSVNENE